MSLGSPMHPVGFKEIARTLAGPLSDLDYAEVLPGIVAAPLSGDRYRWMSITGNNYLITSAIGIGHAGVDALIVAAMPIAPGQRRARMRARQGPPIFFMPSQRLLGAQRGVHHSDRHIAFEDVIGLLLRTNDGLEKMNPEDLDLATCLSLAETWPSGGRLSFI